jgi:hypothetical protein
MKCFLCGRDFQYSEIGIDVRNNPALKIGNKAICISCLHSLSILLKQVGIAAKVQKMQV